MMRYVTFNVEVATEYGVSVAIILEHLFICESLDKLHKEEFNKKSASLESLYCIFPFFTEDQIKESLECIKINHLFNL